LKGRSADAKLKGRTGWGVAVAAVLGLASSMILRVYIDHAHLESPAFDALKSILFWGDPGEPSMHAPPLINFSHANTLIAWAALTGIVAVGCVVRAGTTRDPARAQALAVAVVVSLLTLYCLWRSLPLLVQVTQA
jgi:hypothetical protein